MPIYIIRLHVLVFAVYCHVLKSGLKSGALKNKLPLALFLETKDHKTGKCWKIRKQLPISYYKMRMGAVAITNGVVLIKFRNPITSKQFNKGHADCPGLKMQ